MWLFRRATYDEVLPSFTAEVDNAQGKEHTRRGLSHIVLLTRNDHDILPIIFRHPHSVHQQQKTIIKFQSFLPIQN